MGVSKLVYKMRNDLKEKLNGRIEKKEVVEDLFEGLIKLDVSDTGWDRGNGQKANGDRGSIWSG
jgi:hypothetical protein